MTPRSRRRPSAEPPAPPPDVPAALGIAERFLATRPRTRLEIARRLRRAGVEDAVAEEVLARLERLGYVDDAAFARYWVEQRDRFAPRSRALLALELRRLGVAPEVLDEVTEADASTPTDDAAPVDEPDRARLALAKYLRGRQLQGGPTELSRALGFLRRRGFGYGIAREALRGALGAEGERLDLDLPPE